MLKILDFPDFLNRHVRRIIQRALQLLQLLQLFLGSFETRKCNAACFLMLLS